jgi:hypothetical protein
MTASAGTRHRSWPMTAGEGRAARSSARRASDCGARTRAGRRHRLPEEGALERSV